MVRGDFMKIYGQHFYTHIRIPQAFHLEVSLILDNSNKYLVFKITWNRGSSETGALVGGQLTAGKAFL